VAPSVGMIPVDRTSPVPLYFQVAQYLERAIESGELPPGAQLENEVQLAEQLGLSRPTMRRAMQYLVDRGMLVRRRGIGTQVVQTKVKRPVELSSLWDDLVGSGQQPTTSVLSNESKPASIEVARRLDAAAAAVKGGRGFTLAPPPPLPQVQEIQDVAVLPLALGGFLALLAAGAVGHALAIAVRRRRHELAVLRALGLTRLQTRMVVITQASVLTVIGLAFGVPLGVALGRSIWRVVAGFTPLAYHPPLAVWALLLIAPVALLAANLLAAWPGEQAARLRTGHILRRE